jgi:hypothetical protein
MLKTLAVYEDRTDERKPWGVKLCRLSDGLPVVILEWQGTEDSRIPLRGMADIRDMERAAKGIFELLNTNLDPWFYTDEQDPVKQRKYRGKK